MTKKAIGSLKQGKNSDDLSTVHVMHRIRDDTLLNHINRSDIIQGWEKAGFICVRDSRGGTFVQGKRVKDSGTDSNVFHLNVKPDRGDLLGAVFPPEILTYVKGTKQYLRYTIDFHPDLDGAICTPENGCHRYKRQCAEWLSDRFGHYYPECKGHALKKPTFKKKTTEADGLEALKREIEAQAAMVRQRT